MPNKMTQLENKDLKTLDDWSNTIFDAIQKRVNKLKNMRKFHPRQRTKVLDVKNYLELFQKEFVFVPTDKASITSQLSARNFMLKHSKKK